MLSSGAHVDKFVNPVLIKGPADREVSMLSDLDKSGQEMLRKDKAEFMFLWSSNVY